MWISYKITKSINLLSVDFWLSGVIICDRAVYSVRWKGRGESESEQRGRPHMHGKGHHRRESQMTTGRNELKHPASNSFSAKDNNKTSPDTGSPQWTEKV